MDLFNFFVGLAFFILGIILLALENQNSKSVKKNDYTRKSFRLQYYFGIVIIIIAGLVMVLKEIF